MDKLLTGCYAAPHMHDMLSQPCDPESDDSVATAPTPPPITRSSSAPDIAVAAAPPPSVASTRRVNAPSKVALVLGWVSAGFLLAVLAIVLIRSAMTRSCPRCRDMEMAYLMLRNAVDIDGSRLVPRDAVTDSEEEDDTLPLNRRCAVGSSTAPSPSIDGTSHINFESVSLNPECAVGSSTASTATQDGASNIKDEVVSQGAVGLSATSTATQDGASNIKDDSVSQGAFGSSTASTPTQDGASNINDESVSQGAVGSRTASTATQDGTSNIKGDMSLNPECPGCSNIDSTDTTTPGGQDEGSSIQDDVVSMNSQFVVSSTATATTPTGGQGGGTDSGWDVKARSGAGVIDREKRMTRPNPRFKDYICK